MSETVLDATRYVVMTNAELARLGVPARAVTFERLRRTGHPRRISPTWAPSLGMWGGVRSLHDVARALDMPFARAHTWAQYRRLRTRTKRFARTQAQLAIAALSTPGPAREVAHQLGLLPVEVCLYRSAAEVMRIELGVALLEMLAWSPARLEAEWEALELVVEYAPPRTTVNLSDPEEVASIVDEAMRALREPSEVERALATMRKELPEVEDEEHAADARTLSPALACDLDEIVAEAEHALDREQSQ